ncbi:MAG TPA: DUF1801 domain-containing protein [Patescibacteria group bacterium]|nr:DUF1801 domain-containing protein [Patescibacteria group bacterium]
MPKAKTVDEYIKNAPEEVRGRLKQIRAAIKSAAPKAGEKISYAMPYYGYKGRLVYFAYFKNHIGVYLTPPITQMFKDELKDYETHMATIRFPHDKKLPLALIKKLVKARVKLNHEAANKK